MHYNNNLSNPSEISNAFAAHFQSSYCVYDEVDTASASGVSFGSALSVHISALTVHILHLRKLLVGL